MGTGSSEDLEPANIEAAAAVGRRLREGQMQSIYRTHRARTLLLVALVVAGWAYPMSADALLTEQKKLTAPDAAQGAYFGVSVSLSDDGNTALVMSETECWSAYVFARSGSTWALQQKITAPAPSEGQFCYAYSSGALSADGNTALIGNGGRDAAWVFVRAGSTWTLQQKLTAPGGGQEIGFGGRVALSDDGDTALVAATSEDCPAGPLCGAAYVFVRSGTTWAQQQKLIATDAEPDDQFGNAALAGDGQTALISAKYKDCTAGGACGAAYVFIRTGTSWVQQEKLTASDAAALDQFGSDLALSGDGTKALVAARGAAYVFVRSGSTWIEEQKLEPMEADSKWGWFGYSVALSGDGLTALVGAIDRDCSAGDACGAAYVFVRSGNTWAQQQKLAGGDTVAFDTFGNSVALSGLGDIALVAATQKDCPLGFKCGAAYVFVDKCKKRPETRVIDPGCIDLVQPPFKEWIPVGCEIVDCCPGCPGLSLIDWVIRVDGDGFDAVILRFENLDPATARRLRIEGEARWLKGNRLQITGRGETIIRGFMPRRSRSLRWSPLSPRMTLDRIVAREGAPRLGGQAGATVQRTGTVRVRVEQKVGNVTINHSSLVYRYRQ